MRILISGGPGAGSTSSAECIGGEFDLPVFDSDSFFHKPTDPPFQEQYSPDERRQLLSESLSSASSWILSGSIATWGVDLPSVQFGVFLNVPKEERVRRLTLRERERFGDRIDIGGDLHGENKAFMDWAAAYETRTGKGRNFDTDRNFLMGVSENFTEISGTLDVETTLSAIRRFLTPAGEV